MISKQVIKEHATWFRGVLHLPVNICFWCGYEDDPETAAKWSRDADDDRFCQHCKDKALALLDRIENAIKKQFLKANDPELELHFFDALTEIIWARRDLEGVEVPELEEAERIKRARLGTPVSVRAA